MALQVSSMTLQVSLTPLQSRKSGCDLSTSWEKHRRPPWENTEEPSGQRL